MPITVRTFAQAEEADRALAAGRTARLLSGGTLVMRAVNAGDQSFDTIIRVTDPRLKQIQMQSDTITIGAGVTMSQIIANRDTAFIAPVARVIGGPAIRNMATVGGNLFARHPYGDFAGALLALDARVTLCGGQAVPVAEFLEMRDREPQRLVLSVQVPRPRDSRAFRFLKVSRVKPKGVAVMSISALLPSQAGRVSGARIVYNGMGPRPMRALAAEQALEGRTLDEAGVQAALAVATQGFQPPTDELASEWYRRSVAPVHLKRLLLDHRM